MTVTEPTQDAPEVAMVNLTIDDVPISVPKGTLVIRAAELILLGSPFDAGRAAEWDSLVRSCLTGPAGGRDRDRENAGGEAIGAQQASKRLLKQLCREQIKPR